MRKVTWLNHQEIEYRYGHKGSVPGTISAAENPGFSTPGAVRTFHILKILLKPGRKKIAGVD